MIEEKNCPKCNEPTENGAVFCGNCGFRLIEQPKEAYLGQISTQQRDEIPTYAQPKPHHKKHWASIALIFAVMGIASSYLLPFMGIAFGIVGIILVTSSLGVSKGWIKPTSLILSTLAVIVGLGFWVNAVISQPKIKAEQETTSTGVATINVNTPCYSINFKSIINISNSKGSCSMNAYNGSSFADSSNIYKIVASTVSNVNSNNLDSLAKQAIAQDIANNLPGFSITDENSDLFDGNPAYSVYAYNSKLNVSMVEEAVLDNNQTNTNNFFVIIHAVNSTNTNLDTLKSEWQWNE